MTELCPLEGPLEGRTPKWWLAYFGPKIGQFGHIFRDFNLQFVLPIIYIKIDVHINFEVNQTQFGHTNA